MSKKTDLRVIKTKRNIKNTLKQLLFEKDLANISVTELSARAEINRKTFYSYYSKVEDVLDESFSDVMGELEAEIIKHNYTDEVVDIRGFVSGLNKIILDDAEFYRRVILLNQYQYLFKQGKNLLKKHLIKDFPKTNSMDDKFVESYCEYIASGVFSVYINWFVNDEDAKIVDVTEHIVCILTDQLELLRMKYGRLRV